MLHAKNKACFSHHANYDNKATKHTDKNTKHTEDAAEEDDEVSLGDIKAGLNKWSNFGYSWGGGVHILDKAIILID